MGVGTFYRDQTAEDKIAQLRQKAHAPEIEYINAKLTTDQLLGLYTACDCLVHPYRGEGFGLPIIEAMGMGLAVIVTGYGPALEYCSDEQGYLIPAEVVPFSQKRVGDLETVDYPWLAQPDPEQLAKWMKHVVAHPDEAQAKGQRARQQIDQHWTWEQTTRAVEQRLEQLRSQPIRRQEKALAGTS